MRFSSSTELGLGLRSDVHVVASRHRHTLRQQERLRAAFTADEVLSVSKSPTTAPSKCETSSIKPPPPKADSRPLVLSRAYQCVSPVITLAWAEPLRKWKDAFWAYFDTGGASNGPTEAINGIIELGRRYSHRQRLPQPHQLPTLNASHRRRPRCLHPHPTLKSRINRVIGSVPARVPEFRSLGDSSSACE